jgi:hypothetical protein
MQLRPSPHRKVASGKGFFAGYFLLHVLLKRHAIMTSTVKVLARCRAVVLLA